MTLMDILSGSAARAKAKESIALRRKSIALDHMSTNVMLADADNRIVYANNSLMAMFREAENDIKRDIPQFSVDTVIGSRMDIFHKDPERIAAAVNGLQGTHRAVIHPGGRTFAFIANPVFDESGTRIGTIVEWSDRSLADLVGQIRQIVEQVSAASREIAAGNADLSQRTEEQASMLEETASSMEQFAATIRQNSGSVQEANSLGSAAKQQAQRGGKVMSDVVETMNTINTSASKIVDIIGVIDGIAFQTNILALNAAVEAARAGEQGRGFAVVAAEVRNLAKRSAEAAKEVKELIGDTVSKVSGGMDLVGQAGSAMGELVGSVQRVTDILHDIAAASREQSLGIDQVNKAVSQMDAVTQQNAALVEEAAAAAGALDEQARTLLGLITAYKLDGEAASSGAAQTSYPMPHRIASPVRPRALAPGGG